MSVTEQDVLAIEEHGELFRKMGLDVTPAGPRTLAVNAIPEVLPMEEIIAFLRDALDRLEEEREGKTEDDRLADLASVLACRAAVKAGEPLSPQEMENILNRAEKTKANQTCPHGRPTTLYFTLNELERRFGRK
jgi:DNA mismatch repair protein MutL